MAAGAVLQTLPGPQVRAQTLQELVYKQGSAGITKASVSITFHNNDPANSPSGYEDKELITVTRQVGAGAVPARRHAPSLGSTCRRPAGQGWGWDGVEAGS